MPTPLPALQRGQAAANALMLDTCEITRPTGGPGPVDPETGLRDPAPTVTVYPATGDTAPIDGRCKVQTFEPFESTRETGDHMTVQQRYTLHIPLGAGPIQVGDTATITASSVNPQQVGSVFRVAGLHHKTLTTSQRLLVDEVVE